MRDVLGDPTFMLPYWDWTAPIPMMITVVCAPKKLTRGPDCYSQLAPTLPTAEDIARAMEIPTFDLAPYNNLDGDDTYPRTAPNDYTGALFQFNDDRGAPVTAVQQLDHRALGYTCDTLQ